MLSGYSLGWRLGECSRQAGKSCFVFRVHVVRDVSCGRGCAREIGLRCLLLLLRPRCSAALVSRSFFFHFIFNLSLKLFVQLSFIFPLPCGFNSQSEEVLSATRILLHVMLPLEGRVNLTMKRVICANERMHIVWWSFEFRSSFTFAGNPKTEQ